MRRAGQRPHAGLLVCAGQNGFGPLTRTTPNSSILTGGSALSPEYELVRAFLRRAKGVCGRWCSMTPTRSAWWSI